MHVGSIPAVGAENVTLICYYDCMHHTKDKGDIGLTKTIADLTKKGYSCFVALSEHNAVDLVAIKNRKVITFQVKYSSSFTIDSNTSWNDKNGNHKSRYHKDDFDFFAIYYPKNDKVYYIPWDGGFNTLKMRTKLPKSTNPFYWHEDFLNIKHEMPNKKTFRDFDIKLERPSTPRINQRKVERPTKEKLAEMLSSRTWVDIASEFGVSDNAVRKWAKSYKLIS